MNLIKVLTAVDPRGILYAGIQNTTVSGLTCQKWSSNVPHASNVADVFAEDHNYCRNLDFDEKPWCYTIDPDIRWEFCPTRNEAEEENWSPPYNECLVKDS